MRACPSCKREWPDDRESCPRCFASLVDDVDATITCPECGHVCPARMQSCTSCLALLRPAEVDHTEDVTRLLAHGLRMHRPAGREPFASGPGCSVLRLRPDGPLVVCGVDGLIEANVDGPGIAARPPLTCATDGTLLFRLERYAAVDHAVVAIGADRAPLATFLRTGGLLEPGLDVRDETSAPVARLEPGTNRLVETGGDVIANLDRAEIEDEADDALWVDDQWSLSAVAPSVPLRPLALVALTVAAKVLLGRPEPVCLRERAQRGELDDIDDALGPIGRTIVEGFLDL